MNHDELVDLANKHFGGIGVTYEGEIPVMPPARFTGSDVNKKLILN